MDALDLQADTSPTDEERWVLSYTKPGSDNVKNSTDILKLFLLVRRNGQRLMLVIPVITSRWKNSKKMWTNKFNDSLCCETWCEVVIRKPYCEHWAWPHHIFRLPGSLQQLAPTPFFNTPNTITHNSNNRQLQNNKFRSAPFPGTSEKYFAKTDKTVLSGNSRISRSH